MENDVVFNIEKMFFIPINWIFPGHCCINFFAYEQLWYLLGFTPHNLYASSPISS